MTTTPPKKLKESKLRIDLWDGRELQYHRPDGEGTTLDLRSFLPEKLDRPLEVEIGPGKGEYLARRAAQHPERFFVGIDRRADRVELTERKLKRLDGSQDSPNWLILREDARSFVKAGLPPIQVFHCYQSDPWPKARHHKHRFFRSPDAKLWAEAIVSGGEYRVSTDHRGYFEEILDIAKSWGFLRLAFAWEKTWRAGEALTHFEGIFLRRREPVYKAVFIKD